MQRVTGFATKQIPANKKAMRMQRAFELIERRKVAEKSKKNAVQYATAAFTMAMYELYGWSGTRTGRVVGDATEKWSSFSKKEEHKLIEIAKDLGVEIEEKSAFRRSESDEGNSKDILVTVKAYKHFEDAISDIHLMMASCLIVLHEQYHFGEKRLNAVMELMWDKIRQVQTDPDINIMQLCEKETGIRITGTE